MAPSFIVVRSSFVVKPPLIGEVAKRPERLVCRSQDCGTSQSASLTAPLSGEPYAPRSGRFFYEPRVVIRYPTPVGATTWGARYALRVSRSVVVILSLLPRSGIRRGRPGKASRYALRVSRSVVVILSLTPHSGI